MLTAVVDLPTPPLPEATAMMDAMPGTPRLPESSARPAACGAGRGAGAAGFGAIVACGRGGGRGASMPPPFFSAVSATMAPATPGIALTARSAAARSGSSSCARAAGTVIEKKTFAVGDEDFRDQAERDDVVLEIRTLDGPELLDDGFLGDGHGRP